MWVLLPSFLFISICVEYLFLSLYFQSVFVFSSKVSLLETAYRWVLFFYSKNFLIVSFSPFAYKVIIDRHVIVIVLLVFSWSLLLLVSSFVFNIYLFSFWLHRVLVEACGIFVAACRIFSLQCAGFSLQRAGFSLVVASGLSCCSAQAPEHMGSVVVAHGLCSCGTWAL